MKMLEIIVLVPGLKWDVERGAEYIKTYCGPYIENSTGLGIFLGLPVVIPSLAREMSQNCVKELVIIMPETAASKCLQPCWRADDRDRWSLSSRGARR
jgi:hypothetical protein